MSKPNEKDMERAREIMLDADDCDCGSCLERLQNRIAAALSEYRERAEKAEGDATNLRAGIETLTRLLDVKDREIAQARGEALEEAAKVAERWEHSPAYEVAGQIRALRAAGETSRGEGEK